jgi:hypothetical protein
MLRSPAQLMLIAQMEICAIPTLDSAQSASKTLIVTLDYSASLPKENADIDAMCMMTASSTPTAIILPHLTHATLIVAPITETAPRAAVNQMVSASSLAFPEFLRTTLTTEPTYPHAQSIVTALLANSVAQVAA